MRAFTLILVMPLVAAAQPPPTFRAGTELVQVSVIAQDNKGKPVADLRREDFQIWDDGSPQQIRLFIAEKPGSGLGQAPREPNVFTNQSASDGSRSGYSVILFDNLVSGFGGPEEDGTSLGALKVLEMLRSLPEGEKVALYAVGRKLQIVREFTADRESLEARLRAWKPSPDDAERAQELCPSAGSVSSRVTALAPEVGVGLARAGAECARIDMTNRIESFDQQLQEIAEHLAGVPGRKNLIWMANRFPIAGGKGVQKLMNAGLAIYPVDEAGVCRLCPPRPKDAMNVLAAATGGVAFYDRNDLAVEIREAMEDGGVSYMLGFYQSGDEAGGRIHQLAVRVNRPGVKLRYRTSYRSEAQRPVPPPAKESIVEALNRPVDTNAIPVQALVTRVQDRLRIQAALDTGSLDLVSKNNRWTGKIQVAARFMTAAGELAGEGLSQTVTLNLRPASYSAALQQGLPYQNELKIPMGAVELKLAFANLATGRIGTVTIPLAEVKPR